MAKKIRTVADNMEKKFTSALKKSTHEKNTLPVIVQNGVQVKMPLELVLMRASFSKIQLNIIVTVLKTIGNKVDEIINKKMNGDMLSLFPKEEFGEDENSIQFVIKRKEFGIPSSHIEELKGALRLMRMVPVDLPVTGKVTGEHYTKYTNLCSVTLPNDDLKDYCIVEMNRDVASHILHANIRYATIVDSISRKLRSKYSIRIYWMIMLYAYNGGVTFRFDDFKKQICGSEDKYARYPRFEAEVLSKAKRDIDELFERDLCEYTFDYHPTKEDRNKNKDKGNPEIIIFNISKNKTNLVKSVEVENNSLEAKVKDIEKVLLNELGIGRNRIKIITNRITDDNIESLKEKIAKLQDIRKEDPTKGGGFYATSILNFFDECKIPVLHGKIQEKESAGNEKSGTLTGINTNEPPKNDQKYWRIKWYSCKKELESYSNNMERPDAKEAFLYLLQCLIYNKFDYDAKKIIMIVPTLFIRELVERNYEELFLNIIRKHFGEGVTIEMEQKFQGGQVAEYAEKVQKFTVSAGSFKSIAPKHQHEEGLREFEKKCADAWSEVCKNFIDWINTDEVKCIFKNHVKFEQLKINDVVNKKILYLQVHNREIRDIIENKYINDLQPFIYRYFGPDTLIAYRVL